LIIHVFRADGPNLFNNTHLSLSLFIYIIAPVERVE
jgi:hypothetical protein